MIAISLGWGVQSWTLAAMSALGDLHPVDFAIHSDTTWERASTYEFAKRWTPWLEERGVKVVTVKNANNTVDEWGGVAMPVYTIADDIYGRLHRQCTGDWKIATIRRYLQSVRNGAPVEMWLGITTDEWHRANDSDVKYIKHMFPLLDLRMSRTDCLRWLKEHDLPSPGKSACTFCPFHNRLIWETMKREDGPDWTQAVEVDAAIRDKRPPYPLFVHPARVPLPEAVRIPEDEGYTQADMFDIPDDECDSGYCFL